MTQRTAIQGGSLGGAVVHMIFVLALFRICSSDERNVRQHHDISRQVEKGSLQRRRAFQQLTRLPRSSLTTQGSAVRTRHRPQRESAGQRAFSGSLSMRTYVQTTAKSNKNPTSER